VLVRNPLPANARFVRAQPEPTVREPELRWELGTLAPCARREILLVLAPTGSGDIKNCARVQFEHGQCVTTRITRPAISLRKSGPERAVLRGVLTYRLEVTNTGSAPVTDLMLTDTLPKGLEHSSGKNTLTWDLGTLEPGHSQSVEYQVTATSAGRLCNRSVATAAGGLREQAESCVTVGEPGLSLSAAGPAHRYVNQATSYQLTVSNPGTVPVAQVAISNPLPDNTQFVSASGGGRLVDNQVQWALGTLEPGSKRTVDLVLRARSPGRICDQALASAEGGLTARAEACTEFAGVSGLVLEVVDIDDPLAVGAETAYVISLRNQGTAQATRVQIVATAPPQLAVTRAVGPADNHMEGQKVIFDPFTLAAGAEVRFHVHVKALEPGDVRFKVDLTADQLTAGPVHEEESTTLYRDLPLKRPQPPEQDSGDLPRR
jgi:uncharacterized repeat protein (TIGR01451 family)